MQQIDQSNQQNGIFKPNDHQVGNMSLQKRPQVNGGRFDFEDGGTYCGGWDEGKAHGHGVCTGPKHQGAYAGAWNYGFEVSGAYIWPSGSHYEGQWQNGRRHGLGVEQMGRQIYRGEWSKDGHKGRYGVRESTVSTARYEGTWNLGYQDGYGCETYADGGKYQGQWQEGKRHGYGIRTSAPFGLASHHKPKNVHASLSSLRSENGEPHKRENRTEEIRGGFVLTSKSDKLPIRRNSLTEKSKKGFLSGLKMRKQRSTGDLEKRGTLASGSIRSTMSTTSWMSTGSEQSNLTAKSAHTESNASFAMEDDQLEPTVVETYMGEWKKDKRCGYGVAERTDGLKYEGEWYNNRKHGYGVTTFPDGNFEEGKYKNNILITSQKKKHLFLTRSSKFRERITNSVNSAQRALKMAMQRSDIAISRTATAASKAQNADGAAEQARLDSELAVQMAKEFAPDFKPSVLERFERLRHRERYKVGSAVAASTMGASNSMDQLRPSNLASIDLNRQTLQLTQQQDQEFPVPSTMYSQQIPVTPQTDLSSLITQPNHNAINAINQMHIQQKHQQPAQSQESNLQMSPVYQFQQQQTSGDKNLIMGNNIGVAKGGSNQMANQIHNDAINASTISTINLTHKDDEPTQMLNNMQHQQTQLQQEQKVQLLQQKQHQQQSLQKEQQQQLLQYQQQMLQQQEEQIQKQKLQQQQQVQQQTVQMQLQQCNMEVLQSHLATQIRRPSQIVDRSAKPYMLGQIIQQSSIDHFDHYKRPPSRDSSIDRYARAASRLSGGLSSRQASVDRTALNIADSNISQQQQAEGDKQNEGSVFRGVTPAPTANNTPTAGNGSLPSGVCRGIAGGRLARAGTPSLPQVRVTHSTIETMYSYPSQPFEDVLLRQRTLGQDIIPSPSQPKRTESLYISTKPILSIKSACGDSIAKKNFKSVPINVTLQRKKSLPDFQELPRATEAMSREEVSALGSARRQAVRRQIELNERLRANPFLYLVSPQVKDWLSRQQLVLLVLLGNFLLGILFFKLLT